jgi:hypothetical protein
MVVDDDEGRRRASEFMIRRGAARNTYLSVVSSGTIVPVATLINESV